MSNRDEIRAYNGKGIQDRYAVSDKATEVLVNDVIRKVMKDLPDMSTGDAAIGLLDAAIYVASRLPGVEWDDISYFMKTMSEVIDSRTKEEIEAHYRSSQALH